MLLAVSYIGSVHPVGDSVAVFRLQIAVLILVGAVLLWLTGGRWLAVAAALAGAVAAVPIAYGFSSSSAGDEGSYVFYQKNLLKKEKPRWLQTTEILSVEPDIVTLQEISQHSLIYLRSLFDSFEHRLICGEGKETSIGILSRFPMIEGTEFCPEDLPMAAVRARLPDGSTPWIVSLHLNWPYPASQRQQAEGIAAWLQQLDATVLIGGDFNMVPWGSSVKLLAQASGTRQVGPYFGTFPKSGGLLPLPIDHILLPPEMDARVEPRAPYGSDHMGVVARFGLAGDR